ncbi:MAG: site-specific integrase [Spongiibacteraceae bacterium]|nr:site-specific integrase [Spongiibacteraceae bacterium]
MAKNRWPKGIRPMGDGIQIRITHNGKTYTQTVQGSAYNKTHLALAVKEREHIESRLTLGLPILEEEIARTDYFSNIAQAFLATLEAEYSTVQSYTAILNRYWMPVFGRWLITEIRPSHIKKEIAKYHNLRQKTKKNILIPLRGVFRHALDDEMITSNPFAAVRIKKQQKHTTERFKPEESRKILKLLNGQAYLYFALFFGTGMRPSEMLALRWEDYTGESIHVCKAIVRRRLKPTTKNHESRDVYIEQWLRHIINNQPTRFQGDYLFVNTKGGPYLDTDIFNAAWKEALSKANIRYRIPYTCRHTRASELLTKGIDPAFAAKQLGHQLDMFYRTYAEWIDEGGTQAQLEKMEKLDKNWIKI